MWKQTMMTGILSMAVVGLGACTHRGEQVEAQQVGDHTRMDAEQITVGDRIQRNADEYLGRTVTMEGQVVDLLGPNAFRIDLGGFPGFNRILVVNATEHEIPLRLYDRVVVTGEVKKLEEGELESPKMARVVDLLGKRRAEGSVVIHAENLVGYWEPERVISRAEGAAMPMQAEMIPKQVDGEYFSECRLTVYHKSAGAVGNPCETTEEYADNILSDEQMRRFEAFRETAGQRAAH